MLSSKVKQYVTIKFLKNLGKFTTEIYILLTEMYGKQFLFHAQILIGLKGLWRVGLRIY